MMRALIAQESRGQVHYKAIHLLDGSVLADELYKIFEYCFILSIVKLTLQEPGLLLFKNVAIHYGSDATVHGPGIEPVIGVPGRNMFICIDRNNRRRHETIQEHSSGLQF